MCPTICPIFHWEVDSLLFHFRVWIFNQKTLKQKILFDYQFFIVKIAWARAHVSAWFGVSVCVCFFCAHAGFSPCFRIRLVSFVVVVAFFFLIQSFGRLRFSHERWTFGSLAFLLYFCLLCKNVFRWVLELSCSNFSTTGEVQLSIQTNGSSCERFNLVYSLLFPSASSCRNCIFSSYFFSFLATESLPTELRTFGYVFHFYLFVFLHSLRNSQPFIRNHAIFSFSRFLSLNLAFSPLACFVYMRYYNHYHYHHHY